MVMPGLHKRPATDADVPFLLALRRETMDGWLVASGAGMTDELHLARLMYRFECAEVIVLDGDAIGLLKVDRTSSVWDIIQMQIDGRFQGKGFGRLLLEELLAAATAVHADVRLGVLKVNPARHLYERLGFVVVGEDVDEYRMRWTSRDIVQSKF